MEAAESVYLHRCCQIIEKKLDWGSPEEWTTFDFEELSDLITTATGGTLGATTLKRVWGRVRYESTPSQHTLNTLAKYVGASTWRAFKRQIDDEPRGVRLENAASFILQRESSPNMRVDDSMSSRSRAMWGIVAAVILVGALGISLIYENNSVFADSTITNVRFSSRKVSRGLPNSVVFTYLLTGVEADSFFIQQSWDPRRRYSISKNGSEFTSIYYYPGHFWSKLIADETILREHALVIPTDGWMGLIEQEGPIPIYVLLEDPRTSNVLRVSDEWLEANNLTISNGESALNYFNVGGFPGVGDSLFTLSSEIRIETDPGRAVCKNSRIILIGQHGRIVIPFSIPGCTADLNLLASEREVRGRNNDLSSLGTDLSTWRHISIHGDDGLLSISINRRQVFEVTYEESIGDIVGLRYRFEGKGAVRSIQLSSGPGNAVFNSYAGLTD